MKKWIAKTHKDFSNATKKAKKGDVIIFIEKGKEKDDNWVRYHDIEKIVRHMNIPIVAKNILLELVRANSFFGTIKEKKI